MHHEFLPWSDLETNMGVIEMDPPYVRKTWSSRLLTSLPPSTLGMFQCWLPTSKARMQWCKLAVAEHEQIHPTCLKCQHLGCPQNVKMPCQPKVSEGVEINSNEGITRNHGESWQLAPEFSRAPSSPGSAPAPLVGSHGSSHLGPPVIKATLRRRTKHRVSLPWPDETAEVVNASDVAHAVVRTFVTFPCNKSVQIPHCVQ